ncbi:galactose mutarotase [Rhodobacteraceae bacterium HSP-20]|uniref:Galactose mutarotase n=1 Tax=Paragemmobacter amnigenus TaxID=2852097 RepID=A0ABS6J4G2_9RHOB|nr:aldose epimerase family protein [Rhodobacter amnigenus]MBU9698131.1 galactose mutarotase [Rhodobacter amnigenus]MBV4389358.1 galactose mutarotase [Rhodobacter amnigenus]
MAQQQLGVAPFGMTAKGEAVQRVTLGRDGLTVSVLTWGAVLQGVWLEGDARSLTLGSDRLADYEGAMRYHGSLIGPVVNRLSGARARVAGQELRFEANQDGQHCLHSGSAGTHLKVWRLAEATEDTVRLELDLPDGEGGFPGNRRVAATWRVDGASLHLHVHVTTDRTTPVNFANHSYWNLDGTPTYAGHRLWIAADRYLPTTPDFTPTGEVRPVEAEGMDFRKSRRVEPGAPALDNCFCLSDGHTDLREVLRLTGQSGIGLSVATTEAGIQIYDARNALRPGRGAHEGLAIEAQGWPDAPNHGGFPSIDLGPGQDYRQHTRWQFTRG